MARNDLNPYRGGGLMRGSDPFMSLHREMNRLFDDVFRGFGAPTSSNAQGEQSGVMLQPDIDVSESEQEIKVCADLPGVSENDIHVELNDDVLSIRAERQQERKQENENYHVVERSYGTFQRSLRLPQSIDSEGVAANFENGVLTITVPKSPSSERSRKVQVQGKGQRAGDAGGMGQSEEAQQSAKDRRTPEGS